MALSEWVEYPEQLAPGVRGTRRMRGASRPCPSSSLCNILGDNNLSRRMAHSKQNFNALAFLDQLSKMLALNAGKDKVAKILQYGGKLIAAYALQANPKSELAANAKRIESSAGAARKIFRFGNELAEFQKIRSTVAAANPLDPLNVLAFVRATGMFWYWIFDHIVWAGNINVAKVDIAKHSWNSSVAWFIGLCATIIIDLNALLTALRKEKHLKVIYWRGDQAEDKVALQQQLKDVQAKKNELYLNCFKNMADLAIAANLLKLKTFSQQRIGLFGFISALIGAYQLFPSR